MRQEPDIWVSKSWFFRHAWNYWGWDQFHTDSCERISGCSLDFVLTGGRVVLFLFFLLPETGSTSTEPIRNHKPESKPVIKNFLCPPEHTLSGVHDRVRHKTNMWKERSPLAHGIRQSSPSGWEGCNRSIVLGAYGTDSVVDQEVEKARPKWEWGYLSNAFSQRQPSTSFSPPPEGLPAIQSSTTSWE